MLFTRRSSGWGLTGNEILFIPDSPIQESDTLLDEANSGGSGESKVALGVGVGVGVGGGLLLITLLAWLAVVRTRRNSDKAIGLQKPALATLRLCHSSTIACNLDPFMSSMTGNVASLLAESQLNERNFRSCILLCACCAINTTNRSEYFADWPASVEKALDKVRRNTPYVHEEKDTKTGIKHSKEAAFEGKQSEEGSIALEFTDQSGKIFYLYRREMVPDLQNGRHALKGRPGKYIIQDERLSPIQHSKYWNQLGPRFVSLMT
eukprot:1154528-Pelagomonas_calceolata.AAC.5